MRHRKARNKLGRTSAHRRATLSNMLLGLIEHGRIKTTERKARELRGFAERAVTRATRLGQILTKDWSRLEQDDRARLVHALRVTRQTLKDWDEMPEAVQDAWRTAAETVIDEDWVASGGHREKVTA